jgi:hypothetical protein
MMFNCDEFLRAREIEQQNKKAAAYAKAKKADAEEMEKYEKAILAFQFYLELGGDDSRKLGLPELKDLVKFFILVVDRQGTEVPSNYTNRKKCVVRLERDGKQSWRFWVDPDFVGEEDEGDEDPCRRRRLTVSNKALSEIYNAAHYA